MTKKKQTKAQIEKRREYQKKWRAENRSVAARENKAAKEITRKNIISGPAIKATFVPYDKLTSIIDAYMVLRNATKDGQLKLALNKLLVSIVSETQH